MADNPFKKSATKKTTSKKEEKQEKSFLGVDLPKPFGFNPLGIKRIGVETDKHNPLTQVEDLVTGLPSGLWRLGSGLMKETDPTEFEGFSKEKTPILHQLVTSPPKTIATLDPYNLGTAIGKGQFSKSRLAKRVQEEGVLGTTLSTIGDLSLIAGGIGAAGKFAGVGNLSRAANIERVAGATGKYAGLGRAAKAAEFEEAATAAAARGAVQDAVDLQSAAMKLKEAEGIRANVAQKGLGTRAAEKTTEIAQDMSRLGGELGNIPAKPYAMAARGVGRAVGKGADILGETKLGAPLVKGASEVVGSVKRNIELADLYHRNVTAPSQEAIFRMIERGEAPATITATLRERFPEAGRIWDQLDEDLAGGAAVAKERVPKAVESARGLKAEIASKSPAEWQVDLDAAQSQLTSARRAASALPDGAPEYAAANKAVREAKKNVDRVSAMRKMSMVPEAADLPDVLTPGERAMLADLEGGKSRLAERAKAVPEETILDESMPGGRSFEEVQEFNKTVGKGVRAEFHSKVQETYAPGLNAEAIIPQMEVAGTVDLQKALKARGYTAWDPVTGAELTSKAIKPTSAVLPNDVFDAMKKYSVANQFDKANNMILRAYDTATGKWKYTVLALSPRWHMGNIVGNLAMAAAAGVSPIEMVKYGSLARKMVKSGEVPAELLSSGFHFSEESLAALSKYSTEGGWKNAIKHPIQTSYGFNQYIDDVNRTMIYLAKKSTGVSDRAAIQMALKAAGDFGRLTPIEKNLVRRIMPFYAWQKHITKLTFRLPLEDPARVAWTLHLAEMGDQLNPDPGAEGFNLNTVSIGGQRLNLNALNPFASSILARPSELGFGTVPGESPSVTGMTRAINPLADLALAGITGKTLGRGLENVRSPRTMENFGQPGGPLVGRPSELALYLSQKIPQTRQLQNLIEGETKSRYDTGEVAKTQYPDEAQNRMQQLLGIFGVPLRPNLRGAESVPVKTAEAGKSGPKKKASTNPFKK